MKRFPLFFTLCFVLFFPLITISNGINNIEEGTKSKLIIAGKTYDLQSYNVSYYPSDPDRVKGEGSTANPYNLMSNAVIVNIRTAKLDQEFVDWIFSENQAPKDLQLVVYDTESTKVIKTFSIKGARTSMYTENSNYRLDYPVAQYQTATFQFRYTSISVKYNVK